MPLFSGPDAFASLPGRKNAISKMKDNSKYQTIKIRNKNIIRRKKLTTVHQIKLFPLWRFPLFSY